MNPLTQIDTAALVDALFERFAPRFADLVVDRLAHREAADSGDRWMDTAAAADHLGKGRSEIVRLINRGEIHSEQEGPGCKHFVRRSELDRWRGHGGGSARAARVRELV